MLGNSVGGTAYKTLSQVGITSDPSTGKLELDSDKLKKSADGEPGCRERFGCG